jgi:hypothetical protein
MNVGNRVKIIYGESRGRVGKIKTRYMNPVPGEMKNLKAGVPVTGRTNETLYSILLEGSGDIMYFPKSCLELVSE